MLNSKTFDEILNRWEAERFPHKDIRLIAKDYSECDFVNHQIQDRTILNKEVYMDFAGVFFWEFWKKNKPQKEMLFSMLFSSTSKDISPVTQYSIILALTSAYQNHNVYKKTIYNKLELIMNNHQESLSPTIIDQIYNALY
jgi:hypothetical protein